MAKLEVIAGILALCAVASAPALNSPQAVVTLNQIGESILRLFM